MVIWGSSWGRGFRFHRLGYYYYYYYYYYSCYYYYHHYYYLVLTYYALVRQGVSVVAGADQLVIREAAWQKEINKQH